MSTNSERYKPTLPENEWQLWKIPEAERKQAALYELARQSKIRWLSEEEKEKAKSDEVSSKTDNSLESLKAMIDNFKASNDKGKEFFADELEREIRLQIEADKRNDKIPAIPVKHFDASRYWEHQDPSGLPWEPDIQTPWLSLSDHWKKHWMRKYSSDPFRAEPNPEKWRSRTKEEWEDSIDDDGLPFPWFMEELESFSFKFQQWEDTEALPDGSVKRLRKGQDFYDYAPQTPTKDDPPGTMARRIVPYVEKLDVKRGTELLVAFTIRPNAGKEELKSAFSSWLDTHGIGQKAPERGEKINDATSVLTALALYRIRLATNGNPTVNYWEPLLDTDFWIWDKNDHNTRKKCQKIIDRHLPKARDFRI
jgi:hypothetical protein